jgi:hypothetical protein
LRKSEESGPFYFSLPEHFFPFVVVVVFFGESKTASCKGPETFTDCATSIHLSSVSGEKRNCQASDLKT